MENRFFFVGTFANAMESREILPRLASGVLTPSGRKRVAVGVVGEQNSCRTVWSFFVESGGGVVKTVGLLRKGTKRN